MALITVSEVVERGRFTAGEFEWSARADAGAVDARVAIWVAQASRYIKQAVGASTYASADTDISGALHDAELAYCLYIGYRQRLMILASRPEEAPPEVYIDLGALRDEIATLKDEVDELLAPYRAEYTRQPGLAMSFAATTAFEDEETHYTHTAQTLETLTTQRDLADYSGIEPTTVASD